MKRRPTQAEIKAFRQSLDRGIEDSDNDRGRPLADVAAELLASLDLPAVQAFDASIERGLEEIRRGGGVPAEVAFEALFRKYPDLRPD